MWELGRAYGHLEAADRLEEMRALPPPSRRARPWEDQVAARMAEMESAAARVAEERKAAAAGQPRRP